MILALLIAIPVVAGLAAWWVAPRAERLAKSICLAAMGAELVLAAVLWLGSAGAGPLAANWNAGLNRAWIPQFGIRFHLEIDGLSLLMVLLTALVGLVAVAVSWTPIRRRVGLFYLNLLFVLAGVTGVFLAADLLLFYIFWELMIVPMFFLIELWGHEDRHRAAVKFFLFTQLSGLLMLVAILALYFLHGAASGQYTFDREALRDTPLSHSAAVWLMLGFLAAFLVKLPAIGLHTWLPDAHTEAPTAGSVVLAGLLLKTGAYGLIRFVLPIFPRASAEAAPILMGVGAAGVIYGAVQAFGQTDFKRLVAYSSVSHMGFVLLGVFARNELAMQGAVMQMICHGLSTGALFILAGMLQDRLGTRDLAKMGGLWAVCPRMGAAAMVFVMASLGLPGLGNFVGEFLVLLGAYQTSPLLAAVAAVGLVPATLYSLWIVYRVFHGPRESAASPPDLRIGELAILLILVALLLWLGLFPQPVIDTARAPISNVVWLAGTEVRVIGDPTGPQVDSRGQVILRARPSESGLPSSLAPTGREVGLEDAGPGGERDVLPPRRGGDSTGSVPGAALADPPSRRRFGGPCSLAPGYTPSAPFGAEETALCSPTPKGSRRRICQEGQKP